MGCCPSKHKRAKDSDLTAYNEYPPTERVDVDFTLSERQSHVSVPIHEDKTIVCGNQAPSDMLMDRGDGRALEKSDHEGTNQSAHVVVEDNNQNDISIVIRNADDRDPATEEQHAVPPIKISQSLVSQESPCRPPSLAMPSPSRPPTLSSPSKPPVNYEDVPINSMYHRIHLVEVEVMEDKRRQEQQQEAERREREIQEFKAAMLTTSG